MSIGVTDYSQPSLRSFVTDIDFGVVPNIKDTESNG